MLLIINILQLVLYIAALALFGQGVLFVVAGTKRDSNFFYRIFQILTQPFFKLARWVAPRQIANSQIGFVATMLVVILYVTVSLWKIDYCISVGMLGCR